MVFWCVRRDFAQLRHFARELVDVTQVKWDFGFLRSGEQVQNRVGRAAHGDVECHGVFKGVEVGDAARQNGFVVLFIITFAQFHNRATCGEEQLFTVGVCGEH